MMGNLRQSIVVGTLVLAASIVMLPRDAYSQRTRKKALVDPNAMQILRSMADFLGGLDQFSYRVVNLREDIRAGHRVDYEIASQVIVDRPSKVKVVRQGHLINQEVYYNGKTLTVFSPAKKIYSTADVPATIDETMKFARQKLGIGYPAADLMYSDAYPLLTKGVISATVLGKEMIAGRRCDHLLFTLPGVDFQIWVADRGDPLPFKYIVTDTGTRQLLSIVAILDGWNFKPEVKESDFEFLAPAGARALPFLTVDGKTIAPKQ
jgi:hypothetical protein